jgi:hypothetical protein
MLRNWKKVFSGSSGKYKSYYLCHNLAQEGRKLAISQEPGTIVQYGVSGNSGLTKLYIRQLKCAFCRAAFPSSACLLLHYINSHTDCVFYHKVNHHRKPVDRAASTPSQGSARVDCVLLLDPEPFEADRRSPSGLAQACLGTLLSAIALPPCSQCPYGHRPLKFPRQNPRLLPHCGVGCETLAGV